MKSSLRCLALIRRYEGLRLEAYQDSKGLWTIGTGHTKGVKAGDKITEAAAEELLREDLADSERAVSKALTKPVKQSQFDALVSFTFNVGAGAFQGSTMRKLINAGRPIDAAAEFSRWYKTAGSELGLLRRRFSEGLLYLEDL